MSQGPPRQSATGQQGSVLATIFRVAIGQRAAIARFGGTKRAFLYSMAPLTGLLLAGVLEGLSRGVGARVLIDLLVPLCALLAPPVLSFEIARLMGREDRWTRFATAFNWCQLALPVLGIVLLVILGIARSAGMPEASAAGLFILTLGIYGLWLHWFLARHALALSGGRAALLVLGVNLGTVLAVLGPRFLGSHFE